MKKQVKIVLIMIFLSLGACNMDYHSDIAVIKNNLPNRLLIAVQPFQLMTDSTLFFERFSETGVEANRTQVISLPNIKPSFQPDSAKVYLYIFIDDSVYKYQSLKIMHGILKHSFVRKIEIKLNKVKEPVDTFLI